MGWERKVLASSAVLVLVVAIAADAPMRRHHKAEVGESRSALPEVGKPRWALPEVDVSSISWSSSPVWVFPDVPDEETWTGLIGPELGTASPIDNEPKVDAGGVPSAEAVVDGVRRSLSSHSLRVTNKHREWMRVLDIRAVVLDQRPPYDGTLLVSTERPRTPQAISVDLDQPGGQFVIAPSGRPLWDVKYVNLEEGEAVSVNFTAFTSSSYYTWEVHLTVQYGDAEPEVMVIRSDGTEDGLPFRTVAWNLDWPYSGGVRQVEPVAFWPTGG